MKAEKILTLAMNSLNAWKEELDENDAEVLVANAELAIIAHALNHLEEREHPTIRNAIALAYAILGNQESQA